MLSLASSVPAILLAVVLIISGIAKARDLISVRESFITLQLPPWLTRSPAPGLLPWGEIVLAIALVVLGGWPAVVAAVATLALFGAYLVIIIRATHFDPPVTCGCLGKLGLGVVGPVTVIRNVLLVALSAWVLVDAFQGRSVLSRWWAAEPAAWAWLVVAVAAVLLGALMVYAGQDPTTEEATGQVPVVADAGPAHELDYERTPIPYLSVADPAGVPVNVRHLAASRARLLVYANPGCGACTPVLEALPDFRERVGQLGVHVVLPYAEAAENPYLTTKILTEEWFHDRESLFAGTLDLVSPSAVLLGTDGYLAGGPVHGRDDVLEFFDDIVAALTEAPDLSPS